MNRVAGNIRKLAKRPDIIAVFSLITLAYCIIEYNFIFPVIMGVTSISGGNILDNIMHVIQLIISFFADIKYLMYGAGAVAVAGLLAGFALSGCLYKLNNFLANRKRIKGEFLKGVGKHFLRLSVVSFAVILFSILFGMFMMVVSVPAVAVTRSFMGGNEKLLVVTVIFDVITLLVLFFGFMFFRIYMLFWYPAVMNFKGRYFSIGKYAADNYFWNITIRILIIDVAFILFELVMIYLNSVLPVGGAAGFSRIFVLLFINWIFKTLFFIVLTVLVFSKFLLFKSQVVKGQD